MNKEYKKPLSVIILFTIYLLSKLFEWVLTKTFDVSLTTDNLTHATRILLESLKYVSGPFGLGCLTTAVCLAILETPKIRSRISMIRKKRRNKRSDGLLAAECQEISDVLLTELVRLEGFRAEASLLDRPFQPDDTKKQWFEARAKEAREQERFKILHAHKVQNLLIRLEHHGLEIDKWGFSLDQSFLKNTSWFFADISEALKNGNYYGRTFKILGAGDH